MTHPSWQDWIELVRASLGPGRHELLMRHASECEACGAQLALVRRLEAAGTAGPLLNPPDALWDEAARRSAETDAPKAPTDAQELAWELADVRGDAAAAAGEVAYMARSVPGVSMSVKVTPPGPDRKWEIEGRLWIEEESRRGEIRVILVHRDHVLVDLSIEEGDRFRIFEVAESGWQLELHLPDERTLLVEDPFV